jgi:protein O-GlcNAc transferase
MRTIAESFALAVERQQAGDLQHAEELYQDIVRADPRHVDALHLLGVVAAQKGDYARAAERIGRAIELNPGVPFFHQNLAMVYRSWGKLAEAGDSLQQAVQLKPDYAEAHFHLAGVLRQQGRLEEAAASCRRAIQFSPAFAEAHNTLGLLLRDQGRIAEATPCFEQALAVKPDYAEACLNIGCANLVQGKVDTAVTFFHRAIAIKPNYAEAHYNLGNVWKEQNKFGEAIAWYRRALAINPNFADACNNLAVVYKSQGDFDNAIVCYERTLALKPDFAAAHSNQLLCEQYRSGVTLAKLASLHQTWQQRHGEPLRAAWRPFENARDADRRLRVGFVSADFRKHPVGIFLVRMLEAIDRQQCETICYCCQQQNDAMTARIRAAATGWREAQRMSDEALAEQIRGDRIDMLFDLGGHTANNRLLAFARKPAPIQITWAGYVGTTGLATMDYILADRYQIPAGAEPYYQEKVLRMPDGYICYDPPVDAPPVGPLPALGAGHVTFGSFNNPTKITREVAKVWAEILRRAPGSQLVLKYYGLDDPSTQRRYLDLLAGEGIAPQQIQFSGGAASAELLASYNRVDIALDTFPYSGGLTTCEALWMGVPVVICPGETFAGRHSLSHSSNAGLTETVAGDLPGYVETAVRLAGDLPHLAVLRGRLRDQVAASPLCNGPRFARNFVSLLRDVWRQWVCR